MPLSTVLAVSCRSSHSWTKFPVIMPKFRDNFVATLSEIEVFEGADLAVMFTHFMLVVMATNYFVYLLKFQCIMDVCNNYRVNLKLLVFQP